jgi:hypothetical protein
LSIGSFLLVVLVVIGPTVLVIWAMKRQVRSIRKPEIETEYLQMGLKVASTPMRDEPVVSGTLQGVPFVLEATFTNPRRTVLTVPSEFTGTFEISRDGSRDLSGRDLVESMFPDEKSRDAVRALFLLGFDTIESSGGRLRAIRYLNVALLPPGKLRAVLGHLAVLRAIPGAHSSKVAE